MKHFLKLAPKFALSITVCLLLAGCQTTSSNPVDHTSRSDKINAALERAAISAAAKGDKNKTLAYLEKIYKRKSSDPQAAMNYATGLRRSDYLNRATIVLRPFAEDPEGYPAIKTEFSAIQLALGNNIIAEEYAQRALLQNPESFRAYHYLGIALDAQGMHEKAETAFRSGLDYWQGDPVPIMNNLALNLTSQGFLNEAAEILQRAKAVAPDRIEIERNLRIVTALQQSNGHIAPKPNKKPD